MNVLLSTLGSLALSIVLTVWPVMLLIGAIHSSAPAVPALGFWPTLALVAAARLIASPPTITIR